jgi:hypothetical protein
MGRTSVPRRRVVVLSTPTRRRSRRGREVLLGKQDLPNSAAAPDADSQILTSGEGRWSLLQFDTQFRVNSVETQALLPARAD